MMSFEWCGISAPSSPTILRPLTHSGLNCSVLWGGYLLLTFSPFTSFSLRGAAFHLCLSILSAWFTASLESLFFSLQTMPSSRMNFESIQEGICLHEFFSWQGEKQQELIQGKQNVLFRWPSRQFFECTLYHHYYIIISPSPPYFLWLSLRQHSHHFWVYSWRKHSCFECHVVIPLKKCSYY